MFNFKIETENNEMIEAGTKENAQAITRNLSCKFKIKVTTPKGNELSFSGMNAWAEISDFIGPY